MVTTPLSVLGLTEQQAWVGHDPHGVVTDPIVVGSPDWEARLGRSDAVLAVVAPKDLSVAELRRERGLDDDAAAVVWEQLTRAMITALDGRDVTFVAQGDARTVLASWPPKSAGTSSAPRFDGDLAAWLLQLVGAQARFQAPPEVALTPEVRSLLADRELLLRELRDLTDAALASVAAGPLPPAATLPLVPGPMPITYGADVTGTPGLYQLWIESNTPRWRAEAAVALHNLSRTPTISILVPIYRPDLDLLDRCVQSVLEQSYGHWELCLFDDCSGDAATTAALERHAARDHRIRIGAGRENGGISAATNGAATLATGTFVSLLDQDDELDPDALAFVAAALDGDEAVDVVYTDEDKLDEEGRRVDPYFKPDWSPELLLSNMYLGHLTTIRRTLFDEVGGFRSTHDGSQDYDLALRTTERARSIVHVPRLAYRWRKTSGSTASDYRNKPQSDAAARTALADALQRRGIDGRVESGMHEGTFRIRRRLDPRPSTAIIIPFHDGAALLDLCIRSLDATIEGGGWEVILLDNRSWEPETSALVRELERRPNTRVLQHDHPFNWSAINNVGAAATDAEQLIFMNSDIEARHPGWLEAMLEPAQDPEVGAVGARLLYPDGRIQHAGVVLGLGAGVAWHPFCFLPPDQPGYFAQPRVMRNWSAVTGACMLVPHRVFDDLGGFDESFPTAFNDVDFCLRLRERGRRVVYTPFAELVHHESASRGTSAMEITESLHMLDKYRDLIEADPYFNSNLDIHRQEYTVSIASEEIDPWIWIEWLAVSSSSSSGRT